MKHYLLSACLAALITTSALNAATLIGYWDFNNGSSSTTAPITGDVTQAQLAPYLAPTIGNGTLTFSGDRIRLAAGFSANLPDPAPDATGAGLRLNVLRGNSGGSGNPGSNNGKDFTFTLNTMGYEDLVMSFAAQWVTQSFTSINISYSVAGGSYTSFSTIDTSVANGGPEILTFDFSSISALDNAGEVAIRLTFFTTYGGGTNAISFDNFQFNATAVPEPSTWAMLGLGLGSVIFFRRRKLR